MKLSDTVKVLRMCLLLYLAIICLLKIMIILTTALVQKIMTMYWVSDSSNYHL